MLRISRYLGGAYLVIVAVATVAALLGAPLGSAPQQLGSLVPAGEPIVVEIAYSSEKEAWLEAATAEFLASAPSLDRRPIEIRLVRLGSRDMVADVAAGRRQPTVVSPASSLQIALLNDQWRQANGVPLISGTPPSLVQTPLVLVAWRERASVLWPNGPQNLWQELHAATAEPEGWAAYGRPEWGFVKFGQTNPESSNSGLQTITMLAYAYHNKTSGLSEAEINDPEFLAWLRDVQRAVPAFSESTGDLIVDMLRFGPSQYDLVAVYENLAIENLRAAVNRSGELAVYYPPLTALSDHPYAILEAAWVSDAQRAAAEQFAAFLLSRPQQEQAFYTYGFRPSDADLLANADPSRNPLQRFRDIGFAQSLPPPFELPDGAVLDSLVRLWAREVR